MNRRASNLFFGTMFLVMFALFLPPMLSVGWAALPGFFAGVFFVSGIATLDEWRRARTVHQPPAE